MPLGVKMRDLIYKYGGGLDEARKVKAVIPGGVSMPVLRGDQIDVAVDHESLKTVNSLLGTAGAIIMDDRTCMVRAALVVARFFEHESCGQCTQCREGTGWTYRMLKRIEAGEGRAAGPRNAGRLHATSWTANVSARWPTAPHGRRAPF